MRWGQGTSACHGCLQRCLCRQHKLSLVAPWQVRVMWWRDEGCPGLLPEELLAPCTHFCLHPGLIQGSPPLPARNPCQGCGMPPSPSGPCRCAWGTLALMTGRLAGWASAMLHWEPDRAHGQKTNMCRDGEMHVCPGEGGCVGVHGARYGCVCAGDCEYACVHGGLCAQPCVGEHGSGCVCGWLCVSVCVCVCQRSVH